MKKKAQQEIVGFVLIVVVVVVGLMVYLTISLRSSPENNTSIEVANALDALMKQTTGCSNSATNFDDVEDLFKRAYRGNSCTSINQDSMEYLEEFTREVLKDMMASESSVTAYGLYFSEEDDSLVGLMKFEEGNCTGNINSALRTLSTSSIKLRVELKTCSI